MYIVSALILLFTILNYAFSIILYKIPENQDYFQNVGQVNIEKNRYILPEPKYVLISSIITGLMIGLYIALAKFYLVKGEIITFITGILFICYLIEVTRKIVLDDESLTSYRLFFIRKKIPVSSIQGMYVYTYNKKWLKQHALTSKLVVVTKDGKKNKIIISSFSNKKIFAMMKDNFGVLHHKMYIAKVNPRDEKE